MNASNRIEEIFHEVVGHAAAERPAALERLCGADVAVRREVEALLRADADPGSVPPPRLTGGNELNPETWTAQPVPIGEKPGEVIGRYKLLQQIGEGGFGVVFMAEQREPVVRKVALKIIKVGMDTKQVIARFEAERQALAMMDHPNIARVFDAGATETGRPYFVMELVRGDPITEYCDTNNLSPKERLELFTQVCHAVQHAHQKGIIHRDIKPRNVLVTVADGRPIPKVIDFGIAKATAGRLTEKTLFTEHRALIGTPEYMSPEQAEMSGVDIDTRSDIYSLGVLLYELLTGTTPFDPKQLRSAAWGELQRIIREVEPPKPSTRISKMQSEPGAQATGPAHREPLGTAQPGASASGSDFASAIAAHRRTDPKKLRLLLRGDLDWIVMKCLEKDRTRRYETANGLAADVLRHLRCEPVVAGPPSQLYRLRKLIRRNRGAVAAIGAVALALVLGLAASTYLFLRERDARRLAVEAERAQAQLRDSAEAARAEEAAQRQLAEESERAAVQAREEAEENAYSAALSAAAADLERNDAESVRRQLHSAPERMRGWEWNYLWNESDRSVACSVKLPPAEQGYAVELSPDGTLLAARAQHTHGEPIQLFDTRTGGSAPAFPATIELIEGGTERMSFSPDNRYLAIQVWGPRNVQIFRLSDRRPMMPSDDPAGFHAFLGFDASGDAAAVLTAEGRVELYRIESWQCIRRFDAVRWNKLPPCGAFSPDGRLLAVGANEKEPLRILSVEDGRLVAEPTGDPGSHRLAFSDDGSQLAVLTRRSGRIRVYDTDSWQDSLTIYLGAPPFNDDVQFVEMGAGGLSIVTTTRDGALRVYNSKTGDLRAVVHGHPTVAASVRLDRQRDEIVTAHEDGAVRRWDRRRSTVFFSSGADSPLCFLKGDLLLIGVRSGSDSANQVAIADLAGGRALGRLRSFPVSVKHSSDANGLAASPDQERVAVSTHTSWGQGRLLVFDLVHGHRVFSGERLMSNDLTCVAWSPDGELIASGTEVGVVLLLDGRSHASRGLLEGHEGAVTQLAFLDGGRTLVTASADGTVRYWDPRAHTERRSLGAVGGPALNALAVSPDGAHLAAGDADGKLRVWDARTGESVAEAQGHAGPIRALAFHRDGDRLATGGADRSIRIWDAKTWRELVAFRTGSAVVSLVFSPDGKRLVFAQSDGRIDWFDTGAEADRVVERRLNEESRRVVVPLLDDLAMRYGDLTLVRRHLVNDASLTPVQRQVALAELHIRQDGPSAAAYVPEKAGGTARTAVYEYVLRYRLVRTYMGDWPDFDAVADELLARTDLSQWEREAAADYAISLCSLFDMTNNAADAVIRDSHRNPEDYAAAFFTMEGALQHTPDRGLYRMTLGQTQYRVGLYEEALSNLNQGEARLQAVGAEGIAEQLAFRAMSLHRLGRVEEAAEVRDRLEAAAPHDPDAVRRLDPLRTEVAEVLAAAPATAEALSAAREDVARLRLIVPPMPKDENGLRTLGHFARDSGQPVEAERLFRAAAEAARTRFGPDSIRYALRLLDLGSALMGVERAREAEQCIRDATTLLRGLLGPSATAWCAYSLGSALRAQARYADAEAAFREALELLDYRKSEKTDRQLAFMVELADTLSLEAAADPIPPGKNQTDLFAEAETLLLEVGRIVNELTASAAEDIRDAGQRETAGRLVRLYEQWDAAEPGHGYAAKAAEWRASAEKPATQPATTGSMNEVTP